MEEMRGSRKGWIPFLGGFFVREDPTYDRWERVCQPNTTFSKCAYLALYFIPGLLAAVVINVPTIFSAELRLTHLSPRYLQFGWLVIITLGWHLLSPFFFLRFADGLTFRESLSFLGLDRIDLRGLFVVLPVFCCGFALVSVPYMQFVWNPLSTLLQAVPLFHVPRWSIFGGDPAGLYAFPPYDLAILFWEFRRGGTLLPWLPDEKVELSGTCKLGREPSTLCALPSMANPFHLAVDWLSACIWPADAAP